MRVPEPDVTVSRASASREKPILVGRPAYSLDSCGVLVELDNRLVRVQIPNHKLIVVAARCQLLVVEAPLESAHLLFVADELAERLAWRAQVSLQNVSVTAACANNRFVPRNRADSCLVTSQVSHQPVVLCVPNLSVARVGPHCEMSARLSPGHGRDGVSVGDLAEL